MLRMTLGESHDCRRVDISGWEVRFVCCLYDFKAAVNIVSKLVEEEVARPPCAEHVNKPQLELCEREKEELLAGDAVIVVKPLAEVLRPETHDHREVVLT